MQNLYFPKVIIKTHSLHPLMNFKVFTVLPKQLWFLNKPFKFQNAEIKMT